MIKNILHNIDVDIEKRKQHRLIVDDLKLEKVLTQDIKGLQLIKKAIMETFK